MPRVQGRRHVQPRLTDTIEGPEVANGWERA